MKQPGDMNLKFGADCCGFTGNGIESAASGNKASFTKDAGMINREAKMGAMIEAAANKKGSLVTGVGSMNSMADDNSLIKKY
jgi:hypothetical protein